MCHSGQMEYAIGRASSCHEDADAVFNGVHGQNVMAGDALLGKTHDGFPSLFGTARAVCVDGRNQGGARKGHPHSFGDTVHRIG